MRIWATWIVCFLMMNACNQPMSIVSTKFTEEEYKNDLHQLAELLQSNHPAIYSYISKENFEELKDDLRSKISANTRVGDFVWMCRKLMASVGCGHTFMPAQGPGIGLPDRLQFPLQVKYINSELVVINALVNKNKVTSGEVIHSINDIEVADLITEIKASISADGYNENFMEALINEKFSVYAAYELSFPDTYNVNINRNMISLIPTKIPVSKTSNIAPCPSNLSLEFRKSESLAMLTIRSFNYYGRETAKFKAFVDDAFSQISEAHVEKLIIDIRENGGGDPYSSAHLIQKIADKPFQYYDDDGPGYEDLREVLQPSANVFMGDIYILTNGRNFSTSGHFCSIIKEHNFAKFAGTATGSSYSCNASQRSFTLEHTGLSGSIARTTFKTKVSSMSLTDGIAPDIEIGLTKVEIVNKTDETLKTLITLVNKNNE